MLARFTDWATFSLSIANIILMGWLGLTILLNTEKRSWGAWVASTGLLLGSLFFISHTTILAYGLDFFSRGFLFWWTLGIIPITAIPFAWYLMMLWYAGFWESDNDSLFKRQRYWFRLNASLAIILMGSLIFNTPTEILTNLFLDDLTLSPVTITLLLLLILYPLYVVLCIGLSLDALRKPGPSSRSMGSLARAKARPWLIATTLMFLVVSLMVSFLLIYLAINIYFNGVLPATVWVLASFDLTITFFIWVSLIFLGRSIVTYEIFTGKTMPRRGFLQQWHAVVLLAISFSGVVSLAFVFNLRSIYIILLSAILLTGYIPLLNWLTYQERKRYIDKLRPFVSNEGWYDQILTPESQLETNIQVPFESLCANVLDTNLAFLIPWGALAPLMGPPLRYPINTEIEMSGIADLMNSLSSSAPIAYPIDPEKFSRTHWAIALWGTRGKVGLLLLGEKVDGGLYSQEEIEIAQTSGERLVDSKASAEIAQRLMNLQRENMAESQLLDQQARRVLHDEVLQQLHTAMIQLDQSSDKKSNQAMDMIGTAHNEISNLLRDMPSTSFPEIHKFGLIGALRNLVIVEFEKVFDNIVWNINLDLDENDLSIPLIAQEAIYYAAREAIRNAVKHGRHSTNSHQLTISIQNNDGFKIMIDDNGKGIKPDSKSESSGQGLALHSTMMAVVGGALSLESEPDKYTRVTLSLP